MASRRRLCSAWSSSSTSVLRVSLVLVALALGSAGAVPPGSSIDTAAAAKPGKLSLPRNVLPRTRRDAPSFAAGSSGGGEASSSTASTAEADDFLTFCVDFDELPEQLAGSRDYRVVAVTGCQCSGKSTLLNALFGTGFPVLEQAEDTLPRRTTIGAWVDLQLCSPPRRKTRKTVATGKPRGSSSSSSRSSSNSSRSSSRGRSSSGSSSGNSRSASGGSNKRLAAARSSAKNTHGRKKSGALASPAAHQEDGEDDPSRSVGPAIPSRSGGDGVPKEGAVEGAPEAPAAAAAAAAVAPTPFVLVDVEGTQSRGRGGAEGMEFDSRTTLFAVMAADVIMLNLWAHDVGRADGQAYSVLRSVFEEAVRLYQGKDDGGDTTGEAGVLQEGDAPAGEAGRFPKVLMLVLRDVEEDEHFEALQNAARENMEALWRDVDKPPSLRDAALSEMFDLRTVGLPHLNYQRREFAAKAAALSRKFLDPDHNGFLFSKTQRREGGGGSGQRAESEAGGVGRQAAVPLSMLRQRLEGIWASASTNEHLSEAPRRSEQEGTVAAAALAESCLSEARPKCARLLADVEEAAVGAMPLLQFGSDAKGIVEGALRSFHAKASRSQPPIDASPAALKEKREWLVASVARELEPAFRVHVRHLRGHFHEEFEEAFSCVLGGAPDFQDSSKRMAKSARKNFLAATKLAVPDVAGVADVLRLHWEAELVKLNEDMESREQDRLSEGTWMLPPDPAEQAAAAAKKKMPWWKGLLLRGAAMYFNYLQATQHMRRAKRASERRERDVPRLPLF